MIPSLSIFGAESPVLRNSLLIAFVSTTLACVLGLIAAFALAAVSPQSATAATTRRAPRSTLRDVMLALCVLPMLLPNYVVVSFWMEALGTGGWLSRLMAGGHAVPLNGLTPTVLTLALIYWSPVALLCYFTLARIDRAMIESAELALGKWRAKLRVVAPLLWPSLVASGSLVFVLAFSNFSVPAIFQVNTIQNKIYVQFNVNYDVGGAFLFAMPQLVSAVAVGVAMAWMLKKRPWITVSGRSSGSANMGAVATPRRLALAFLVLLLISSTIAPMVRALGAVFQARILWQTLAVSVHQIWNSFWFAFVVATMVIGLAVLAGNVGAAPAPRQVLLFNGFGRSRRGRRSYIGFHLSTLDSLFLIPFVLPEVLVGIALIAIFNRPSLQFIYTSVAIVWIALTIRYFIVGRLAVSVGHSHIDPLLIEAAGLAGLPPWTMLWRIRLPLMGRWLFAGWWLVYLFCLADVGSLVLIYPPGCDTIPIRIFNLLHYGYDAQISVLCLVTLVLGAMPWLAWRRMTERNTNHD